MNFQLTDKHYATTRYPCPDGTSPGYGTWNGTIFQICDAAFNFEMNEANQLAIGLGVGLGLGISLLLCICIFIGKYYSLRRLDLPTIPYPRNKETIVPFYDTQMVVKELSEKAYTDFCFDNLTEELKHELMVLRIRKGRNLDEFVKLAERRKADTVATWISRMNPGEFPREVQLEAARPHVVVEVGSASAHAAASSEIS